MKYYIASCVFTAQFPELSKRIQDYVHDRFDLKVVRCCVPSYKIKEFEDRMPDEKSRAHWASLPDSGHFQAGDVVYSLCHNCNNIIDEVHTGVEVHSLWELLDSDEHFPLPDLSGMKAVLQDCWRSRDRADEQAAVRSLLRKMHVVFTEALHHHTETDFCGISLLRPQPPRNPKLAPRHYVDGTEGLFEPHTPEEQERIMQEYVAGLAGQTALTETAGGATPPTVICYCHYCLEGLKLGGADAHHLAALMFA